jgi:hypothetical protein
MSLNRPTGPRGFFQQVSRLFFGKVRSTVGFETLVRAAKAPCGTVWQLRYIKAVLFGKPLSGLSLEIILIRSNCMLVSLTTILLHL